MFTKQEAAQIRKEFWTVFGRYMQPVPFAGEANNWINYKTGVKNIRFQLNADNSEATVAVEIGHTDQTARENVRKKFLLLSDEMDLFGNWEWREGNDAKEKLEYFTILEGINILKKEDWPGIISFFKEAMISLDHFWSSNKEIFENDH